MKSDILVLDSKGEVSLEHAQDTMVIAHQHKSNIVDAGFESHYANTAIPMSMWYNRFQCADFVQCAAQNGPDFGALPITNQIIYQGPNTYNSPLADIIELHG